MFVQHMLSVLKPDLRMATIMPQGVLFRRRSPRRAPPQRRPRIPRGQGPEFSPPRGHPQDRPRYRARRTVPGYARLVPVEAIAAEDFNCNIRRHVDNAPPPRSRLSPATGQRPRPTASKPACASDLASPPCPSVSSVVKPSEICYHDRPPPPPRSNPSKRRSRNSAPSPSSPKKRRKRRLGHLHRGTRHAGA